jgi:hypothetical protein
MNKSVSHYLRDYLQLTGSAKFNSLTGGADRALTASESADLSATLNKYMVDIVPAVAGNDVFKKQLMTKDQFDTAKAADPTYGVFADYAAFTADWKDVQKALVTALLATADAEMAAQEAAAAGPGAGPGAGKGATPPTPGKGAKPATPTGTGAPGANPFTFRLRGGAAPPSLLAAAMAASGVVVASGNPELNHFFTYFSSSDKKIPDEFFTDLAANRDKLKELLYDGPTGIKNLNLTKANLVKTGQLVTQLILKGNTESNMPLKITIGQVATKLIIIGQTLKTLP